MSLAILFPGQGSQYPGMLADLPASPAVTDVMADARHALARLGLPDCPDSRAALREGANVQVALLISGVATARALTDDCGLTARFVAGHSVGAFAAAVAAGALTVTEALEAVVLRARSMARACANAQWGMAAITGLATRSAEQLVAALSHGGEQLWIANVNSASQTVVSGTVAALDAARQAAMDSGATDFERLPLSIASHCPIQQPTAQQLALHLAGVRRRTLTARYLTNVGGRAVGGAELVIDDLAQAVSHPVQWYTAISLIGELGVTVAVEAHPGRVLTRLFPRHSPVTSIPLQDNTLDATASRVRQHLARTEGRQ